MNLQHLEYFFAIAENKSVSKAAEALHVSQPSLSRVLKSMETEMGAALFKRTAKGVELTVEGGKLYYEAKRAVNILNNAKYKINTQSAKNNSILTIYATMEQSPLDAIEQFKKNNPSILIDYHLTKYSYEQFVYPCSITKENTICIIPEVKTIPAVDDIENIKFRKMEAKILMPEYHHLADRDAVKLEDLVGETFILPSTNSPYRYYSDEIFKSAGFVPIVEKKEVCDEPMTEIGKKCVEINQLYYEFGYHPKVNLEILVADFRNKVMLKHDDVTLIFHSGNNNPEQGIHRANLIAPNTEKYSYMLWPRRIAMTDVMKEFISFMIKFYEN